MEQGVSIDESWDILESILEPSNNELTKNQKNQKKLGNILECSKFYLGNPTFGEIRLDESLIKSIHTLIMKDLPPTVAGEFRTTDVMSGNTIYPHHKTVPERLRKLIDTVSNKVETLQNSLQNFESFKNMLVLSTFFYSEFLFIHPFSNGNGRTARIIFAMLMKPYSKGFIVSIYNSGCRENYINSIESRETPEKFLIYVMECCKNCLFEYVF